MRGFAVVFAALVLAMFAAPGSEAQATTVVINELQPSNDTTIADGDGDFEDWIELRNTTAAPIDVSGWQISDATATWSIPAGPQSVIPANGFLLIWASDKGDPIEDGFPGPAGQLHANFKLSSGGDSVTLRNNTTFAVVDTVTYSQQFEGDESYGRDGAGNFVVFSPLDVTPLQPNGDVTPPTPTPTPTPTAIPGTPSIVINEVMQANTDTIADGDGNFEDWIELYNPTCSTIDLTGWSMRDSSTTWEVPAGTTMAPNEFLFIWASRKGDPTDEDFPGPAGEVHTNFRLSAVEGEDLFLLDGNGLLVGAVNAGPSLADESYALTSAGTYSTLTGGAVSPGALNPGQTLTDCSPTPTPTPTPIPTATPTPLPGEPTPTPTSIPTVTPTPTATVMPTATPTPAATATPTVAPIACSAQVTINEVQSRNASTIRDGDGDTSDWIELFNPGGTAVDLGNWRISDSGNTFVVPAGTSIGAGEYLLIWASDKGDPSDPEFPGPAGEIHANFRLSGEGELVSLTDATSCPIDQVPVPLLQQNDSFGITTQGTLGYFAPGLATPGGPNGQQYFAPEQTCFNIDSAMRINRIVASNDGLLLDADGDDPDFIELRNTGFDPVDISVWRISDANAEWIIPTGTVVGGNDTIIIFASGKGFVLDPDYPGPAGELHTNFRLTTDGEQVTLADPGPCVVDQIDYPALGRNETFGYDAQDQLRILEPGVNAAPCAAPGSVRFVAAQAKNESTRTDEDGDNGDWFELRVSGAEPVDLSGWTLSDDFTLWVVPDGVVAEPDVDLVVWADEKNRGGPDIAPHTNFKLSSDGETLTLGSSADCLVDELSFPALDDDQVYRLGTDDTFAIEGSAPVEEEDDEAEDDGDDESAATVDVTIVGTCLAINEIMAKNDVTLADSNGEFGDWIELVNLGDDPIDLSGYEISDEETPWTIPDGVEIGGGEYLLIWADEGDNNDDDELHTNFKLGSGGEPVTLRTADGDVAASFSTYPELDDDEAFGVNEDGDYVLLAVGEATPGEGPAPADGCDFEISAAASAPAGDDDDSDGNGTGDNAADAADDADDSADGSGAPLATTGTNARLQSFVAQMLLLSGVLLVIVARIAIRRATAEAL